MTAWSKLTLAQRIDEAVDAGLQFVALPAQAVAA